MATVKAAMLKYAHSLIEEDDTIDIATSTRDHSTSRARPSRRYSISSVVDIEMTMLPKCPMGTPSPSVLVTKYRNRHAK